MFALAQGAIPDGLPDSEVLSLAAQNGCVLVSHDLATMPAHFWNFLQHRSSPGLILIPQRLPIAEAIAGLQLLWECLDANDFRDRILYLPL